MSDPNSWPALLALLLAGSDLDADRTAWAMDEIMSGDADPAQVAGFLVALRAKGETAAEIDGLVRTMLARAHRIAVEGDAVDVVGTGGDGSHTVNISTMAALVVAGTGALVVKHGNRAASSLCGAADVLEELGVDLALTPAQVAEVARRAGITFCFARVFHPAFRFAGPIRSALGVPTAFNFLGPLTNPAQPHAQAVGCGDARMAGVMAEVFARRGASALVFRGDDGLDELTTTTTSQVHVVRDGVVRHEVLDPARLGIAAASVEDLRGGDAGYNAAVVRTLLAGKGGAVRDAVVLNAAGALVALSTDAAPLEALMADALVTAAASIDSGAAAATLERWVETTRAVGAAS